MFVKVSENFSSKQFTASQQHLKPGNVPGFDSLCPELLIHAGTALKSWLRGFVSSCLRQLKIPRIYEISLVISIPKPIKPFEDPRSYRPISLLRVPYTTSKCLSTTA